MKIVSSIKMIYAGSRLTFHSYKGINYMRSYIMRPLGKSHGYDYFIPEANGKYRYFPKLNALKEYVNALVEYESAKNRLAKFSA